MKTYYYLYKITNTINNKIYIGVHRTANLDDGYMGSGTALKRAMKEYGKEFFTKEIIKFVDNEQELLEAEKEIVNEDFVNREDTYNLTLGGVSFYDLVKHGGKEYFDLRSKNGKKHNFMTNGLSYKFINKFGKDNPWYGIQTKSNFAKDPELQKIATELARSPECLEKKKRIYKEIKHQVGEKNSQYGTMWITNERENKKIKCNDIIPAGWRKGRKMSIK